MSKTENWLDNPFRTIIEYCELKVMRGGKVMECLEELEILTGDTPNKVVKDRLKRAIDYVVENHSPLYKISNYIVQAGIIEDLKVNLK